ncbi:homeobox protein 13-like isoform X2 [Drosophila elegans]|uniref:homeobox protein 13-like isoform X2 n=1 Tax=Drosophila elegans TaxID=30023 RepID=UPI001BC853F4|nr:homeobox protein 13-like isoform X2 [Drosophila elegans]
MRDYPSVPNVFRVASTHSINSESPYNNNNNNNSNNSNFRPANVNCNTIERQPMSIHQLTTSASIEHSHPSQQQQQQQQQQLLHPQQQQHQHQQHSPYATLPRGQRFAPQQHQNAGVINTISGSIPATGFGSLAGSFSDLQLNNITSISNHNSKIASNQNNRRQQQQRQPQQQQQQQQQQQHQQQRQVASLNRHQSAKEMQQQQHQQQQHQQRRTQQQHVQPQQQHRLAAGAAGASDPQGGNSNMTTINGSYLWLLTPVAASISVAIVIAALAGPQWLFTEEKLPNANYNGTANFNALDDGAYITKFTKSSLWILCTTPSGVDTWNCVKIDYFPHEGYQPDPHDSTAAIPYTVTKSCPIFLAAGVFLVISFIVFLIPTCSHQNNLYYFSAGILFIVSGLVMLIGLIAYISILKAEIGSKLRPRSTLQPALIKVSYGQSFFLFVFGFIVTEFVGVLNIFLFINLQEISYYSKPFSLNACDAG